VKRRYFVLCVFVPLALPLAIFVACTSSPAAAPTSPPPPDLPIAFDARLDTSTPQPDPDAAPPPTCTAVDLPVGTGAKFCELPLSQATGLSVPEGFCIREYTTAPLVEPRVMRFAPNGDLFIAAPSMNTPGGAGGGPGAILVLPDDNGDGRADSVLTFAGGSPGGGNSCATLETSPDNLACVHGLVFSGGYLYYTRSDEVRRVAYTAGTRSVAAGSSELVAILGGAAINDIRWTHTLDETKDKSLWVSRGRFDSSTCSTTEMETGAVFSLAVQNKAAMPVVPELVANGFRNPMYVRCSPASCGDCYASELSGDGWDGVGGREKLALLDKKGESWGYPCCVQRNVPAVTTGSADCTNVGRELVSIALHDTPFGFDFEPGTFPGEYRHGVFAALHGVVTSFGGSGVVFMKTDPTSLRPTGEATMFVHGFGRPIGRATDVAFAPDGRLFIADDTSGKIYWVAPTTLAKPN
jgi:glucose/arabinose dehydrogenase